MFLDAYSFPDPCLWLKNLEEKHSVEVRAFTTAYKIILLKGKNGQLPKEPSCQLRFYVISEVSITGNQFPLKGVFLPKWEDYVD